MKRKLFTLLGSLVISLLVSGLSHASEVLPIFDAHMHYNAEARATWSPQQVLALWRKTGVKAVLATSRPNTGTLDLLALNATDINIVPFLRPYQVQPDRYNWFANPDIAAMVEKELARNIYRGIGEFHIFGADADAPYMAKLAKLAQQRGLWLHAHADEEAIERILAHAPSVKIIWAHTGMNTSLTKVANMFAQHPNLVGELSYRGDLELHGKLNPEWHALLLRYPGRFVLGTDTWVTPRWDEVPDILAFYRRMLSELPRDVAEKIAYRNGAAMFGLE